MDKVLSGKVAIVTGAASGIGRATVIALAKAGASVVVSDLNGDGANVVAEEIKAAGGKAIGVRTDVGSEADIIAMVEAAVSAFGGIDILHNNAAASGPDFILKDIDILSMDTALWDKTMEVNLRGPMLACKYAIPHMLKRGGGAIINTSSISGMAGDLGRAAYGVSKGGLNALTQYVATIHGKQNIRCNAVAPGIMDTPPLRRNLTKEQIAIYERSALAPRLGTPEDVAATVVFLASPGGSFITGQIIAVDGGLLAHHPAYSEFIKGK